MSTGPDARAHVVRPPREGEAPADRVVLGYDARLIRRKRLVTASGASVLVDLPRAVSLEPGDVLELEGGGTVLIEAAEEDLLAVTAAEADALAHLAWHIGNRHTPCEIGAGRIVIRADPVLARMLEGLGARVAPLRAPFRPGGGAYGHGRVMGHGHGHGHGSDHAHAHSHDHSHAHSHDPSHARSHDHSHDHSHAHSHDPSHAHSHDHAGDVAPGDGPHEH